jgi:hypothetical protein
MPESKINDFVWGGSQKNFAIFEDKVFERFIDGNGGRIALQWYMNSDASITEHNLEGFGNTLWNMQRLEVGTKKATKALIPMHFGRSNMLNHGGGVTVIHFSHGSPLMPLVTSLQLPRRSGEMVFGSSEGKSTKTMALERLKTYRGFGERVRQS